MRIIIWDIETLLENSLFCFYIPEEGWKTFSIDKNRNEIHGLVKFMEIEKDSYFVGFNSLNFDAQVLERVLRLHQGWVDLDNLEITRRIWQFAQDIIHDTNFGLFPPFRDYEISFRNIDLFKIHHYDNESRRCSLKWLEFMMDLQSIEEMPIEHFQRGLTNKDLEMILDYCKNDILATYKFYKFTIGETEHEFYKGKNKIQDRLDLIEEKLLDIRALNYSDSKIGDELNKRTYCDITGKGLKDIYNLKKNRKPTRKFTYGDAIPDYVRFKTPELQSFYDKIKNVQVSLKPSDKQKFPLKFRGTTYYIARGGIHSNEKNRIIVPKSNEILLDADIGSQYPNAIRKRGLYPDHLGIAWNKVGEQNIRRRLQYKERGKDNLRYKGLSEAFKLALNSGFFGKGNTLNSKIITPEGITRMGDIKKDDCVIDCEGNSTKVTNVFPLGKVQCYRVIFTDGSFTEVTDEHLWEVTHYKKTKILTTHEIIKKGVKNKRGENMFRIPVCSPVKWSEKELPIDPYLLGCLIGDGNLSYNGTNISSADLELIEYLEIKVPSGIQIKKIKGQNYDYKFVSDSSENSLTRKIKSLGLQDSKSYSKFIPEIYKFGSIEQRLELLRGLMDTDGTVQKTSKGQNSYIFTTTSEKLSQDLIFLVQSLGGIAKCHIKYTSYEYNDIKKEGRKAYSISIRLPKGINPFRLSRKADLVDLNPKNSPRRSIVKIEDIGMQEAQCIKVSNDRQLYLCDQFIVTHNTIELTNWQYGPEVGYYCTIGNQFEILMLIEMLELQGIKCVSANTDGILCLFPRMLEHIYYRVCEEWEEIVGNTELGKLEFTEFKSIAQESVNHYIAVKSDGQLKIKGRFLVEGELHKNNTDKIGRIERKAIVKYFSEGVPIEKTIRESKNIYDFVRGRKSSRDYHYELIDQETGEKQILKKVIRYFVSASGKKLFKVKNENSEKTGPEISECEAPDDDRIWYCEVVNKIDKEFSQYNIDYEYYIRNTERIVSKIDKNYKIRTNQITLFM